MGFIISKKNGFEYVTGGEILFTTSFASGIVILSLVLAGFIALYILRSIGVYKLAKRKRIKQAFMAWIPFVWVYPAYKLISEYRFFGFSYGKFAVWFCVIFAVSRFISAFIYFFDSCPYIFDFLQTGNEIGISFIDGSVSSNLVINKFDGIGWLSVLLAVLDYINLPLRLVSEIILISFYIALFRKYWPEHYIIASIVSVFGLFPIFVFVIRNKSPRSYADYVRARYYNAQNYGMNNNDERKEPENPFSEFGDKKDSKPKDPGDPFSDFFNDKDKH